MNNSKSLAKLTKDILKLARDIDGEDANGMGRILNGKNGSQGRLEKAIAEDLMRAAIYIMETMPHIDAHTMILCKECLLPNQDDASNQAIVTRYNSFARTARFMRNKASDFLPKDSFKILENIPDSPQKSELLAHFAAVLSFIPHVTKSIDGDHIENYASAIARRKLYQDTYLKAALGNGLKSSSVRAVKKKTDNLIQAESPTKGKNGKSKANEPQKTNAEKLAEARAELDKLIGLESVKTVVGDMAHYANLQRIRKKLDIKGRQPTMHMSFTGNPGTGKTTVARLIGKIYAGMGILETGKLVEVDRGKLVGAHIGQTEANTRKFIKEAKGGVLLLDEAYALTNGSEGATGKDFGLRALEILIKEIEDGRADFVLILTGYAGPMKKFMQANEGMRSRISQTINFPDYDNEELLEIMDLMLKEGDLTISKEGRKEAAKKLEKWRDEAGNDFGNARDVRNLLDHADKKLARRLEKAGKLVEDENIDHKDKELYRELSAEDIKKADFHKDDTPFDPNDPINNNDENGLPPSQKYVNLGPKP